MEKLGHRSSEFNLSFLEPNIIELAAMVGCSQLLPQNLLACLLAGELKS